MAEGVGFEPTRPFGLPVFKTGAFNRSATPPNAACSRIASMREHEPVGKLRLARLGVRRHPPRSVLRPRPPGLLSTGATAPASRPSPSSGGRRGNRVRPAGEVAETTGDDPLHGLPGFRMASQRAVVHRLANLESLRFLRGRLGDGFVDVSGHGEMEERCRHIINRPARDTTARPPKPSRRQRPPCPRARTP